MLPTYFRDCVILSWPKEEGNFYGQQLFNKISWRKRSAYNHKEKTYIFNILWIGTTRYICFKRRVIKTSIIFRDGREFNISYIKGPDIISLLKDEVSQYTSAPFNVRIESETATFYRIPRVLFWEYVNQDTKLQDYVNLYYRNKLAEAIFRQQLMTMNGKNGAVCAFIYQLIPLFGREVNNGILIDFQVTNDDIAGFCGISTRNSVNRILRGLREENVITMVNQKIVVLDKDYLKQFIQA